MHDILERAFGPSGALALLTAIGGLSVAGVPVGAYLIWRYRGLIPKIAIALIACSLLGIAVTIPSLDEIMAFLSRLTGGAL